MIKLLKMKKIVLILIIFSITVGCEKDFLTPDQVSIVYNEVFWKSEEDAQKAVLGIYSLYRGLMVNAQMYNRGDVTTGYFNRGWNGGSSDALYRSGNFSDVTGTQKSWGGYEAYADWNGFYKVIAQCNLAISHIEEMPADAFSDDIKDKLLGEAHFLRALTYYNIATIWGNAPLVLESIESSDQVIDDDNVLINKPRSTDIQIMDAVLSDVEVAVNNLEYGGTSIRANKGSAEALAGYANLWMAFLKEREGEANNSYIDAAVKSLEGVVNNGGYSLNDYSSEESVQEMFQGFSSEAIFELNISFDDNESYRVDNGGIEFLTSKLIPLDGDISKDRASSINFVPFNKKEFVYPEYPEDRRAELFWEAWDSNYNEPFSDVSQVATDRDKVTWLTKFASFRVDPAAQWNEYVAYFAEANIPIFRLTDVKLLLAEAYIKDNQPGRALPIINEIRDRAGLQTYSGDDLLAEVLQQRVAELIGEGKIFFDFVRNNYFPGVDAMTSDRYAQEGYYWPVSSTILTTNKMVEQTPYWNGKTTW